MTLQNELQNELQNASRCGLSIAPQPGGRARVPSWVGRQQVARDRIPGEQLEALTATRHAVVLTDEEAVWQRRSERAVGAADAVGAGDLVAVRPGDRVEDRAQRVVAVAIEQPETILALHRGDQHAAAVARTDQFEAFDLRLEAAFAGA